VIESAVVTAVRHSLGTDDELASRDRRVCRFGQHVHLLAALLPGLLECVSEHGTSDAVTKNAIA
jgi:hypothetical protein